MSLLPASVLNGLHQLPLIARRTVDGLRGGTHRSLLSGQSIDFADHRPYVPGDDTRHLDWKVLARADRLVLKRYESERDLAVTICLDQSASMTYQGQRAEVNKFRYGQILAACLAHLALDQGDRPGLFSFSAQGHLICDPKRSTDLGAFCHRLEEQEPIATGIAGDALQPLRQLAEGAVRASLLVVISDLLDPVDEQIEALRRLRHRGHDVVVLWVLDPDERDLAVDVLARFTDLEGDAESVIEPRALRQAYQEQVAEHQHRLAEECRRLRCLLVPVATDQSPQIPLNEMLVGLHR